MSSDVVKQKVFRLADQLLLQGQPPVAQQVLDQVDADPELVEALLAGWWRELSARISFDRPAVSVPDVPDVLSAAFARVWQQAVQEATSVLAIEKRQAEHGAEAERRVSEDALKQSHDHYQELEARYREQSLKLEKALNATRTVESEVAILKNSLGAESAKLAKEKSRRMHLEQELEHLRKIHEEAKRNFDQRVKDEQRHNVEALSKADADVRHYRSSLEKLRDEVGKREAVMVREINELQAQATKKDARIDTQKSHNQSLEEELRQQQQEAATSQRELTRVNAVLLSELNKSKRLQDRVSELEAEVKQHTQRQHSVSSDATRRENALHVQLQAKDDELMRANAKVAALESRLSSQDEELKRVTARQ